MQKLVFSDQCSEFTSTVVALIKNGFVVQCIKVSTEKYGINGEHFRKWEWWVYFCPVEMVPCFQDLKE